VRSSFVLTLTFAFASLVTVSADADPTVRRATKLIVMTPSPTQSPGPSLRLRTMVRPADHLWVGPDVPSYVALEVGKSELDLLDPRPGGGFVATYRERFDTCGWPKTNCDTIVKLFDASGKETDSVSLKPLYPRPDQLEVQDVRLADDVLYYNEACQTYSRDAGGKCSALVAYDLTKRAVLWRTGFLVSNNELRVVGPYIVTAYGFTAEPATITVVRRKDGAIMDHQALASTNFEMSTKGDVLSIEVYKTIGTVHYRLKDFDGAAPKLVPLPSTPSTFTPKPYDPPLQSTPTPVVY
jgi:hypothetical protein